MSGSLAGLYAAEPLQVFRGLLAVQILRLLRTFTVAQKWSNLDNLSKHILSDALYGVVGVGEGTQTLRQAGVEVRIFTSEESHYAPTPQAYNI